MHYIAVVLITKEWDNYNLTEEIIVVLQDNQGVIGFIQKSNTNKAILLKMGTTIMEKFLEVSVLRLDIVYWIKYRVHKDSIYTTT